MPRGFTHLLDPNKVHNATGHEPDPELVQEVEDVADVVDVGSAGEEVDACRELEQDQDYALGEGVVGEGGDGEGEEELSEVGEGGGVLAGGGLLQALEVE